MSFFSKVTNFIKTLEAEIDQDFNKKNFSQEVQHNDELENIDGEIEKNPEGISHITNNESEESIDGKKEKLLKLKEEFNQKEKENEEYSSKLAFLQNIQSQVGEQGKTLLCEFKSRTKQIEKQIQAIQDEKERISSEINASEDDVNYSHIRSTSIEIQSQLHNYHAQYESEEDKEKQLKKDFEEICSQIDNASSLLIKLNQTYKTISDTNTQIQNNIKNNEKSLEQQQIDFDHLQLQYKTLSSQFTAQNQEINQFNSDKAKLLTKIKNTQAQIQQNDHEYQLQLDQKRIALAESMRSFTVTKMKSYEVERQEISKQKDEFISKLSELQTNYEHELKEIESFIITAEFEHKELESNYESSRNGSKKASDSLQQQLDNILLLLNENQSIESNLIQRANDEMTNIKQKYYSYSQKTAAIQKEIQEITSKDEKQLQDINNINEKIQQLNNDILELNKEISDLENSKLSQSKELSATNLKLSETRSKFIQVNNSFEQRDRKFDRQQKEICKLIDEQNQKIEKASGYGKMAKWKDLTKKCGALDYEREELVEEIKKDLPIRKIFNESLKLIAEKQESIDRYHSLIDKERSNFKTRLLALMG